MIIIFSAASDPSTDKVVDWINYYNGDFIRINDDDFQQFIDKIELSEKRKRINFNFKGRSFSNTDVKAVWFRRNSYSFHPKQLELHVTKDEDQIAILEKGHIAIINRHLAKEYEVVRDYVFKELQKSPIVLGHWQANEENKLEVLSLALSVGLKIPTTTIVSKVMDLNQDTEAANRSVTKSLSYSPSLILKEVGIPISSFTTLLTNSNEDRTDRNLFWSLVQNEIKKQIEIRVFYLNGKCYSMAIFSQVNKETSIDFRNYDTKQPNRTVPYQLPTEIETKIDLLMQKLKLNTGSIDLILSKDNEYIFLEVNPVGQFGMVSSPCNYYLEQEIAKYLVGIDQQNFKYYNE